MMLACIRDSAHTTFLLLALECETDIQPCVVTDRSAKSIPEIYFVEERLFTFNTLHSTGHRKNVAGTFVENIAHQQCHIKQQHRMEKL
jgi:hypothetical protein